MKKRAQDHLDVSTRQIQDLVFSEASSDLVEWDLREEICGK